MGNPVLWLSGANSEVLARCPTDRPKYVGIGSAVLITAAVAGVSMTFALHTGLGTPLGLAIPLAVAWGLAIMNLDRWLVVSLQRDENTWHYLRLAIPRLLLALLFGVIISTPVVLQIFRPEIDAEIPTIQRQNTSHYYQNAAHDAFAKQITAYQARLASLNVTISRAGQAIKNIAQDPQIKFLRHQKNKESRRLGRDQTMWQFGPNATLRTIGEQNYKRDLALRNNYVKEINTRESQISTQETDVVTRAQSQITIVQGELSRAQAQQAAFVQQLKTQTGRDTGLLIRLQALDALAARNSTVWWAKMILFLFFTAIECLPIIVKVLLNLGPPNTYEKALALEEGKCLRVAEEQTFRAQAAAFTEAEQISAEAQRMAQAWSATDPAIDDEAVAAADRVARARLAEWEKRAMREIAGVGEDSARPSTGTPRRQPWSQPGASAGAGTGRGISLGGLISVARVQLRWLLLRKRAPQGSNATSHGGHFSPYGRFAREWR
jgi:hypothetical protein